MQSNINYGFSDLDGEEGEGLAAGAIEAREVAREEGQGESATGPVGEVVMRDDRTS